MKKPMLLSNDEFNPDELDYTNMFISAKRDGVRAEVTNEGIKNRSLKILRNVKVQNFFKEVYQSLPNGMVLEAEIHSATLPCREIAGICNSLDKDVPEDLKLYIFGAFDPEKTFEERYKDLLKMDFSNGKWELVLQTRIYDSGDATRIYELFLHNGFEGAVLMDGRKKYKEGRVTIKEHIGFKMKPHKETDLEIIDVTERLLNTNESEINELGRKFKRNTVDAKEETGVAATFVCKLPNGMETKVTITGDEEFRREIWQNRDSYIGQYAVVKSMAYGEKDRLRHPRLISIKHKVEK